MVTTETTFEDLRKHHDTAQDHVEALYTQLLEAGKLDLIFEKLRDLCEGNYPEQGLIYTGYEGINSHIDTRELEPEIVNDTVFMMVGLLHLLNHPDRLQELFKASRKAFEPPRKQYNKIFAQAKKRGESLTIHDLELSIQGDEERVSRTEALKKGPFISYKRPTSWWEKLARKIGFNQYNDGREQARGLFVAGANPEATGSSLALSLLATAQYLACLPRDGMYADTEQQVDLALETFRLIENSPLYADEKGYKKDLLIEYAKHNVVGVVEANPEKALKRAQALYDAGIRTFRIYSPEPGNGALNTLKALRAFEQQNHWQPIEIFVGQVTNVQQAKQLEKAGANGLYLGIGGGGRCITGQVGDLAIDWPQLLWELRGAVKIPIIVEGGANDHVPLSVVLGASGIGIVGKLLGTIETPGGYRFFVDELNRFFSYYGGEASNRMRAMAGRVDFGPPGKPGRANNKEGETSIKYLILDVLACLYPTILEQIISLEEQYATANVFQTADSPQKLQHKGPRGLRRASQWAAYSKGTH